ncbi:MAG: asparagine synthase (glutamine-hydrolyzing) [Candidatus Glassbacteria bacterium]
MCGVCGIYTTSSSRDHEENIIRMVHSIRHRGPDDMGWETIEGRGGERVYLGNTRLSVIDTSPLGHQPMTSKDGSLSIVYNGEIYNFPEIKKILAERGHSFRSGTDTEVLLNAYLEWGTDALNLLNGMFAFAVWDRRRCELVIARDRLGIKPLYYSVHEGTITFASEIKALLTCDYMDQEIDPSGLADYLSYQFTLTPRTIFSNIKKLRPGTFMRLKEGKLSTHTYWTMKDIERDVSPLKKEDCEEALLMLLRESVRKRLISDVPLGVFLSGGLDSSLVVGLMAEATGGKIKTFSMGFPSRGEEAYNELEYARRVARYFDTDHHEHIAKPQDIEKEIEKIAYHFDEPFGGGLHTYFISALARRHVTVVLSGLGGDELFAGYEWNRMAKIIHSYKHIPGIIRRGIIEPALSPFPEKPLAGGLIQKMKKLIRYDRTDPVSWYPLWISVFHPEKVNELLDNGYCQSHSGIDHRSPFGEYMDEVSEWNYQDRLLYLQLKTTMLDDFLNYTDKMSMAHSLECRVPYLDHELVEYSMSIPFRFKMKGLIGKHILRRCAKNILPEDIVARKKQGFLMPIDVWMRGDMKPLVLDCLLGKRACCDGMLNRKSVEKILEEFFDQGKPLARHVWSLFTFTLWREVFLNRNRTFSKSLDAHGKVIQNDRLTQ